MNIQNGNARWVFFGIYICALCVSLNGYAQVKKSTFGNKAESNDHIVELTKQIGILAKHSEDSEKHTQQTLAHIQTQITQLQIQLGARVGAQVQEVASISGQYITYISFLFGILSFATVVIFSVLGYFSRQDFKNYSIDMKNVVETKTSKLDEDAKDFRNQILANQSIIEGLQTYKNQLKPALELEEEIKQAVNKKYQPPENIKRDIIEILLYNHDFSQGFRTILTDELRRLGGNQPPKYSIISQP